LADVVVRGVGSDMVSDVGVHPDRLTKAVAGGHSLRALCPK